MQSYILPVLVAVIIICGAVRKVNVFDAFIEGAKNGLATIVSILPTLCALFFLVGFVRASGALDVLGAVMAPLVRIIRLPPETVPLLLLRPLSGSGATAFFKTIVTASGADSLVTRTAAVMLGSSETTLYTVSTYCGAAGIKATRYMLPCALIGDVTAFIAAGIIVGLFFK